MISFYIFSKKGSADHTLSLIDLDGTQCRAFGIFREGVPPRLFLKTLDTPYTGTTPFLINVISLLYRGVLR